MNDLRTAAQQMLEQVQEFKRRWWLVPAFGNKVNKATREAITNAHSPIFELEHALRAALAEPVQEPVQDERTTISDLRCAKWLDPECADKGACQSLKFKRSAEPVQEPSDTAFDRWWDDALDGPPPIVPVSKETAQWIWNAARAEPVQEPDSHARRCGGPGCDMTCCQPVGEPVQQALVEADRIMGHDDEATEWRERWAHLFGVAGSATSPWRESAVQDCSPGGTGMPATPPQRPAEPMVWTTQFDINWALNNPGRAGSFYANKEGSNDIALYTAPPQRKPLPASDIVTMYDERPMGDSDMIEFARAVERAHGIGEQQ